MRGDLGIVDHRAHGFRFDRDDLGDFVRGAETIEKMDHRNASGQRCSLGDQRKVLRLLHRIGAQHGAAGGATGHYIGMVAENRQRMRGQRPRRHMQHERRQLAGDLVQIGNEQQQALAGGETGRQRAGSQRAMQRTGRAALRLHLDDLRHRAPQVGLGLRSPFVGPFAHVRRRRDRVDRDHFIALIRHARGGFIAVEIEISGHCVLPPENSMHSSVVLQRSRVRHAHPPSMACFLLTSA